MNDGHRRAVTNVPTRPSGRRQLLLGALGGACTFAAGCAARAAPLGASSPTPAGPVGPGAPVSGLVPLPFKPSALKGLSERLIVSHHENNYGGAVRNLRRVEDELARVTKDTPPFVVAGLREKELAFRNSKALHEAYFGNLGGSGRPGAALERALGAAFGSSTRLEEQLRAAALGLAGGSGWVMLYAELGGATAPSGASRGPEPIALRVTAPTSHTQAPAGGLPLLVLDMYEHSYHLDYGAAAARYVDAFFANVDYDAVERRLESARRLGEALAGP